MSSSKPETAIFTTDTIDTAAKKVMRAFTGGRDTVEEQRKLGGCHELCNVYAYYYFLFEEDDRKLVALANECRSGSLVCGDCKTRLAKNVGSFIAEFQEKREKARDNLEGYFIK